MSLATAKTVEVYFENVLETINDQQDMVPLVDLIEPDGAEMQNAGNVVWRPVEQQASIIDGWDITGQENGIIQEAYPAILGTPKNTFIKQRADDVRDMSFWRRQGQRDGRQQAVELNTAIANTIKNQGSQFYRFDTSNPGTSAGYRFIAEAQALLNEEQRTQTDRHFMLNDRDNLLFSGDLAGKQTMQGKPDATWRTGQIGNNIAEFDIHVGSFLPNLAGGAASTTVTGDQSFAPQGGTVVTSTGVVTNNDYRVATIAVAASASFAVGDKVTFANVEAVGVSDKSETGRLKTFTIVDIPDGTNVTVYPKPIALDDPALNDLEKAYANVNTRILNTAAMTRLNTDASKKTNLFWDKDSIEVIGGNIPADLFSQFDGKRVITETLANGLTIYMVYDGSIDDMSFRYRCFTWWGVTNRDPQRNGVAVTF